MPLRFLSALAFVIPTALAIGGIIIVQQAPALVETAWVQSLGRELRWSGMYAMTNKGCFFIPSLDIWARNVANIGWLITAAGFVSGVATHLILRRLLRHLDGSKNTTS